MVKSLRRCRLLGMAETQVIETPTDSAEVLPTAKPNAANRYRCFNDGQGDYRVYEVAPSELKLPAGTLLQIPEIPGFEDSRAMTRWLKNSGDKLKGKQFLTLKGLQMGRVTVETVIKTEVEFKPRVAVTGPASTEAGG